MQKRIEFYRFAIRLWCFYLPRYSELARSTTSLKAEKLQIHKATSWARRHRCLLPVIQAPGVRLLDQPLSEVATTSLHQTGKDKSEMLYRTTGRFRSGRSSRSDHIISCRVARVEMLPGINTQSELSTYKHFWILKRCIGQKKCPQTQTLSLAKCL